MAPAQKIGHSLPLFGRSLIQSVSLTKDSIRPARSNLWIILLPCFTLFISLSAAISLSLYACVLTSLATSGWLLHAFSLLPCYAKTPALHFSQSQISGSYLTFFICRLPHIHQVICICSKAFLVNKISGTVTIDLYMHWKMETCKSLSWE